MHRVNNQRGDTIVEVLVAVAIVGLILVSSYGISSQSTRRVIDTQEHSKALQLVQAQVEQLRSHAGIDTASYQCFSVGGGGSPGSGAACQTATTPQYTIKIEPPNAAGVYWVHADWESILGSAARVSVYYRL